MFKRLLAILVSVVSVLSLTSCSGNNTGATMKDGEYRAEYKNYDNHGWKDYVVVTVVGGMITDVEYDAMNKEDSRKKSEDSEYLNAYPSDADYVKPDEYTVQLENDLVAKQDIEQVDVIATATTSSESFKKLVNALMTNIKRGKTDTVIVDNPTE